MLRNQAITSVTLLRGEKPAGEWICKKPNRSANGYLTCPQRRLHLPAVLLNPRPCLLNAFTRGSLPSDSLKADVTARMVASLPWRELIATATPEGGSTLPAGPRGSPFVRVARLSCTTREVDLQEPEEGGLGWVVHWTLVTFPQCRGSTQDIEAGLHYSSCPAIPSICWISFLIVSK